MDFARKLRGADGKALDEDQRDDLALALSSPDGPFKSD